MKHISTADALRALEEAVAEKGEDYIYPWTDIDGEDQCAYLDNKGNPSCIAGHALVALGVPKWLLADHNTGYNVGDLWSKGLVEMDADAREALQWAQTAQDSGHPWGEALRRARRAVDDRA